MTKLTSMTEVALLLWMIVVTRVPIPAPTILFRVTFSRMDRRRAPADCCIPSLMVFMPKRNSPIPPSRLINNIQTQFFLLAFAVKITSLSGKPLSILADTR